eukprot:UN06676
MRLFELIFAFLTKLLWHLDCSYLHPFFNFYD